jgi:hypothetical protein
VLEALHDVEMLSPLLALASGRSLVVRAEVIPSDAWLVREEELAIPLDVAPLADGLLALSTTDRSAVETAISTLTHALDRFVAPPSSSSPALEPDVSISNAPVVAAPAPPPPSPEDVPPLGSDGRTVSFSSRAQYEVQHRVNLEKGALVVKADPLPPGTKRDLQLTIPGSPPISVSAQVMFQGAGVLGFSISLNDAVKAQLRSVLEDSTPAPAPLPRPPSNSARMSPALGYEAELAPPVTPEELLTLASDRPAEIAGAKRSYLRVLDFLLASEHDVRLRVTGDEEIVLWIYRGRVVFSQRKPEKPDDLLGRRLVASRVATRAVVDAAVAEVGPGRPLGTLLVDKGKISQEQLTKELRAQIVDRASAPCGFSQGSLQVLPWTDPPVKAKLLPVAGKYLIAELAKNELKRWSQDELVKGLAGMLERELRVELEAIDPVLRLGQKEQRFYQRAAQSPAALADIGVAGGAGQNEGLRLAVVACAAGFARLQAVARSAPRRGDEARQNPSTEDILLEQLERSEKSSPFDVLGLPWTATLREIRRAYDAERKQLMMRKRADGSTRDLVAKMEKKLDEALRTLTSIAERKSLRESAAEARERQHAAEHLVQQAELAIFREDFEAAADLLDTADELFAVRRSKQLRAQLQRAV